VQRGHNKQVVFTQKADFCYYLSMLEDFKMPYGEKIHGFCLMTNHVHLILQPGEAIGGLGKLMNRLSGRQTRFVNRQNSRTGRLRVCRYRSSPIETDAYWLAVCRYVELNPVRARITDDPATYPWSSYGWHAGVGSQFGWLEIDPCFEGLGKPDGERAMPTGKSCKVPCRRVSGS